MSEPVKLKISRSLSLQARHQIGDSIAAAVRLSCAFTEPELSRAETDSLILALQLARVELWPDAPGGNEARAATRPPVITEHNFPSGADDDKRMGLADELRNYAKRMTKIGHDAAAEVMREAADMLDPADDGHHAPPSYGPAAERRKNTAETSRSDDDPRIRLYQSPEQGGIYWRTERRTSAPWVSVYVSGERRKSPTRLGLALSMPHTTAGAVLVYWSGKAWWQERRKVPVLPMGTIWHKIAE